MRKKRTMERAKLSGVLSHRNREGRPRNWMPNNQMIPRERDTPHHLCQSPGRLNWARRMWYKEARRKWVTGVSSWIPPTGRSKIYQEGNPFLLALPLFWLTGSLVLAQNCYKGFEFHHPFYLLSPFLILSELKWLASNGCYIIGQTTQRREARGQVFFTLMESRDPSLAGKFWPVCFYSVLLEE